MSLEVCFYFIALCRVFILINVAWVETAGRLFLTGQFALFVFTVTMNELCVHVSWVDHQSQDKGKALVCGKQNIYHQLFLSHGVKYNLTKWLETSPRNCIFFPHPTNCARFKTAYRSSITGAQLAASCVIVKNIYLALQTILFILVKFYVF